MEINCELNRTHSIAKLIDHAQLHVKIALALHVIKFVQITDF